MELQKNVSNPMLMGAIELMKADPSEEHKKMLFEEIMKADYLVPALIEPTPVADGEGRMRLSKEQKIAFPMLKTPDGRKFFAAFTDKMEYEKYQKDEKLSRLTMKMEEIGHVMLRGQTDATGCVINPGGCNIMVPKEMMQTILAAKFAALKQAAQKERKDPE